jgi:hypothetical protein
MLDSYYDVYLASRFDCWMILAQCAFNPVEKLYTNNGGHVISIDEMDTLSDMHEENEGLFEFQAKLQKLGLNEEENCILAAMCVMSTGMLMLTNLVPLMFKTKYRLKAFTYIVRHVNIADG